MPYKFSTRFPYFKKKKRCANAQPGSQRVIVPQGLVNPSTTTIIEIPRHFQDAPALVAKPRVKADDSYSDFCPIASSSLRNSYIFPKESNASASLGSSQYSTSGSSRFPVRTRTIIETTRYTEEEVPPEAPANVSSDTPPIDAKIGNKAKSFPRTGHPKMSHMYEEGVSYGGMPYDFSPNRSGSFYKDYIQNCSCPSAAGPDDEPEETGYDSSDFERRAIGFDPYVHGEQFKKQFSPYMNFDPCGRSSPKGYQQSAESYLDAMDNSVEEPHAPSCVVPAEHLFPYKRHHTRKTPGGEICSHCKNKNDPQSGLKNVLDQLDLVELTRIQKDLKDFQSARRKLIFDASRMKH